MEREKILNLLKENKTDFTLLVQKEPGILKILIDIESTETSAVKFAAEKAVRTISESNPELFMGIEGEIFSLLKSENTFIRLGNIVTCGNLAALGTNEILKLIEKEYVPFVYSKNIAEFGNAVGRIPKIISVFPSLEEKLIPPLFEVNERVFIHKGTPSEECRNVAAGKAIDVFMKICKGSPYRQKMMSFAENNLTNTRNSTKRKAEKLVKSLKDKE